MLKGHHIGRVLLAYTTSVTHACLCILDGEHLAFLRNCFGNSSSDLKSNLFDVY